MNSKKLGFTVMSVIGLLLVLTFAFGFQNCARIKFSAVGGGNNAGVGGLGNAPSDADGDGLSDDEETVHGTNPTNPDTDGDGLTDGAEVNTHNTDPLDADTDNGGVNDGAEVATGKNPLDPADDTTPAPTATPTSSPTATPASTPGGGNNGGNNGGGNNGGNNSDPNADPDQDGLNNGQEQVIGTNPNNPDTDNDGLTDGEEVNTHNTNPLDPDTDDGGVKDGPEVDNGTNPLDPSDDVASEDDVKNNCARFNGRKTLICHNPPGNSGNKHNICVGTPSVQQHKKLHGDYEGQCK